ncbi:unnamed protein product [Brassica oleracea]
MVRTYMCGDLKKTINFPYLFSHGFMVVLLCSCVLAFLLNYIIFLNTTLNSALTQTICGNMKVGFTDLFTVGLGWMIFGGLPFRPGIILHLSIYIDPKIANLQFATSQYCNFGSLTQMTVNWTASWFLRLWFICILQDHWEVAREG